MNKSVVVFCGTGLVTSSFRYYNVTAIRDSLGEEVCTGLPFYTSLLDATQYQVSMVIVKQSFGKPGLNQNKKKGIYNSFSRTQ